MFLSPGWSECPYSRSSSHVLFHRVTWIVLGRLSLLWKTGNFPRPLGFSPSGVGGGQAYFRTAAGNRASSNSLVT